MIRFAGRALRIMLGLGLLGAVAWGFVRFDVASLFGGSELGRALTGRGRVAVFGVRGLAAPDAEGSSLVAGTSLPTVGAALAGSDPSALLAALEHTGIDAVLVGTDERPGVSIASRLASYRHVDGLRGLYLARDAALYGRDTVQALPQAFRDAAAVVARRLLEGARVPSVSSFPEPLRRVRPVEVMVLLRQAGRARLWRSARGSSIASALNTAASVARQRWEEREQAMGGPLARALPGLDVEVALLEEDGTLGERDPAFIDRVFFPGHGVGYERKGAWRYLLPEPTQKEARGHPSRAYRKLFVDDGLPADSFERHELRLYRLMVQTLAVSKATVAANALSEVKTPDDVLDASP